MRNSATAPTLATGLTLHPTKNIDIVISAVKTKQTTILYIKISPKREKSKIGTSYLYRFLSFSGKISLFYNFTFLNI